MKVQAHNALEPPVDSNQDQTPLTNKVCDGLFNYLESYENNMQFQISSRRENR